MFVREALVEQSCLFLMPWEVSASKMASFVWVSEADIHALLV